jgi:hypothetical protein
LGAGATQSAYAASDVSNTPTLSNKATGSVAASIASSQASTIISTAATGGFTAGTGGFSAGGSGGFGGFSGGGTGGNGGFSGGGTGGSGGFGGTGGTPTNTPNQPQAFDFRLNGGGESGGDGPSRNGVWAQGMWADVDKTEQYLKMHGNVYNVAIGADHRFSERFLVGVALAYENVDFTTTFNTGKYKDDGETVTPYFAYMLSQNWTFDAAASYSWLTYHANRDDGQLVSSSFSGNRFGASANLTGNFANGNWRFLPKAGLFYSFEHQNSYTDSALEAVDTNSFALGRFSAGGKVGYDFEGVMPFVKLTGDWDFRTAAAVVKINGQMSEVDHGGAEAGVGLEVNRRTFSGSLEADYNSLGRQDLDVWAIIGRVRWEF